MKKPFTEDGNKKRLEFTEDYDELYWAYNLPLQLWPHHANPEDEESPIVGWRILNYMPRKERCTSLEELVTKDEIKPLCKNTAKILRNLANRFEMLARGEIDYIYYPNKGLEDNAPKDNERTQE